MTLDTQQHAAVAPRPRFVAPLGDAAEPPVRVVEYVRLAPLPLDVPERWPASARWPIAPQSRLPSWLARLLLAWGVITLASLAGPCRPLIPSPAQATEASR